MSSTIDYQRVAYRYQDNGEPCFVVLHEAGSSNVFVAKTGKRARDWYVLADGWSYSVHGNIMRYAAGAIGGMLRLNRMHSWTSTFDDGLKIIRAYDKALKTATPLEQASPEHKQLIDEYRLNKKGA